jgi:hypothetical protein
MISDSFLEEKPPLSSYSLWNEKDEKKIFQYLQKASSGFYDKYDAEHYHFLRATVVVCVI